MRIMAMSEDGELVAIVGYRKKMRGSIQDEPATYAVFVEQTGRCRMGTVRATALEIVPQP